MSCWGLRALFIPLGDVMGKIIYWEEKKLREEKWIGESQIKEAEGEEFFLKRLFIVKDLKNLLIESDYKIQRMCNSFATNML